MKKNLFPRIFAVVMIVAMLMVSCLSIVALSVSAPNNDTTEDYYSVVFEDGVMTVRVNPDKIHEMLKDGDLTKEELSRFVPDDVLETLSKGSELTLEDLKELVANYISVDDLKALIDLLPVDVVKKYFSFDMILELVEVEELISLIPVDDILNSVDVKAIEGLLTEEAMELLLNEKLQDAVVTEEFVENLISNSTLVDDVFADEATKAKLVDLVDDDVVDSLMADPVLGPKLLNLASSKAVVEKIADNEEACAIIADHLANSEGIDELAANPDIQAKLVDLLNSGVVEALIKDEEIGPKLWGYLSGATVVNRIIDDTAPGGALSILEEFLTGTEHDTNFNRFIHDKNVDAALVKVDAIREFLLKQETIHNLVDKGIVTQSLVEKIFTKAEIDDMLGDAMGNVELTDTIIADFMDDDDFVDEIFGEQFVRDILTQELIEDMYDLGYIGPYDPLNFPTEDEIKEDIKEAVKTNSAARNFIIPKIRANSDTSDYLKYLDYIDPWKYVDVTMMETSIKDALEANDAAYKKVFDLVDPSDIIDAIGMENCRELIHENAADIITKIGMSTVFKFYDRDEMVAALGGYSALISKGFVEPEEIADAVGGYDKLIPFFNASDVFEAITEVIGEANIKNYVDIKAVVADLGGYPSLVFDWKFLTVDQVADAAGGYGELIRFFDTGDIIDAIGMTKLKEYVNIQDVVDSVGGYSALIKLYTNDELVAIVKAIGTDNIANFVKNEVLSNIDYKAIAKDVINHVLDQKGDVKALVKTIANKSLTILLAEIEYISINGENVYEVGTFDLNKIIIETLRAIPDIEDLINLTEDAIFAEYDIEAKISGQKYTYGINFGFIGDPSGLINFLKNYVEHFRFDASDEGDIDLQVILPGVVSDVYAKALNSPRVPDALKEKLIMLPTLTVEDAKEYIAGFSEDEIQALLDTIVENADAIKEKAYAKIDAVYAQHGSKLPDAVQQKIDQAKGKVDDVLELLTSEDATNKMQALQNKVIGLLDKVYGGLGDKALMDFYNGNGNFSVSAGVSVDVFAAINKYISLPDEIKILFESTVLSFDVSADITMQDLYKLELLLADGSKYETLLPAGTSLDVLNTVSALGNVSSGLLFGDTTEIKVMPASDVKLYSSDLYSVQFVVDEQIIDTVFYVYGADSINAPALPEGLDKAGYTVDWEDYELNVEKRLKVGVEYNAIEYTAYFWADAEKTQLVGTDTFTVEDTALDMPAVPVKTGYDVAWGEYTIGAGDIDVFAVYTAKTYIATFVAGETVVAEIEFTIEDTELDEPDVPAKLGYTGVWEDYEIIADNITINAIYTAEKYTATFKADGDVVAEIEFTIEDTELDEPAVPAKVGYTGAWESYTLEPKDITINAVYTPIVYTATFVADGKVVGTDSFTVEDKSITEPAVPAKEGYTGKWEDYTLGAADITINAIYTKLSDVTATPGGIDDGGLSDGGFWWWWILIIIAIIIIALIIFFIFYKKNDDDDDDLPPPDPEPIVEPKAEVEYDIGQIQEVDDILPEEADELMSDDVALASVIVDEDEEESVGPRAIINIGEISDNYNNGEKVDIESLKAKNLIPAKTGRVKVLADGHLNKHNLTVEANSFSVQVIKMIKLTGGTVIRKK